MERRQDPEVAPRTAKADFSEFVLVCRKCAKRQGVSRKRLGRAIRDALGRPACADGGRDKRARKVRVVETGCLGPCPKRMLTLATPQSLARARVILVDPALDGLAPGALRLGVPATPPAAEPASGGGSGG